MTTACMTTSTCPPCPSCLFVFLIACAPVDSYCDSPAWSPLLQGDIPHGKRNGFFWCMMAREPCIFQPQVCMKKYREGRDFWKNSVSSSRLFFCIGTRYLWETYREKSRGFCKRVVLAPILSRHKECFGEMEGKGVERGGNMIFSTLKCLPLALSTTVVVHTQSTAANRTERTAHTAAAHT